MVRRRLRGEDMIAATIRVNTDVAATDGRRASDRRPVARPSTLREADRLPHAIDVLDLSSGGFRFRAERALPVGAIVSVGLSGPGAAEGRIVWREGRTHGCVFTAPQTAATVAAAFDTSTSNVVTLTEVAPVARTDAEPERWSAPARSGLMVGGALLAWGIVAGAALLF